MWYKSYHIVENVKTASVLKGNAWVICKKIKHDLRPENKVKHNNKVLWDNTMYVNTYVQTWLKAKKKLFSIMLYHVMSSHIISYHIIPYHIWCCIYIYLYIYVCVMLCQVISYHIIPYIWYCMYIYIYVCVLYMCVCTNSLVLKDLTSPSKVVAPP